MTIHLIKPTMTTPTKSITQTPTNPPRIQPQHILHRPSMHKLPIHLIKPPQPQRTHPQNPIHRRKNKTLNIQNIKNHQKHILTKTKKQVHPYNTIPPATQKEPGVFIPTCNQPTTAAPHPTLISTAS